MLLTITFCCDIYHSKIISNIYINIYSEYKKLHNKPNMLKNIIGSYNKYIRKKYRLINDYPYSISCYNDKFIIILFYNFIIRFASLFFFINSSLFYHNYQLIFVYCLDKIY